MDKRDLRLGGVCDMELGRVIHIRKIVPAGIFFLHKWHFALQQETEGQITMLSKFRENCHLTPPFSVF
jgi:hypothetical protein